MTLTSTTIPSYSGPGSNGNEGVFHIPFISRTGTSPSNSVKCHTQNIPFLELSNISVGDTVSVLYALPTGLHIEIVLSVMVVEVVNVISDMISKI